jgi:hypothetical protein
MFLAAPVFDVLRGVVRSAAPAVVGLAATPAFDPGAALAQPVGSASACAFVSKCSSELPNFAVFSIRTVITT